MPVTAALAWAAFASVAIPFAAAHGPNEAGMSVVGDAKIESGGMEVAHAALNTPLGVDADLDFPASEKLERAGGRGPQMDAEDEGAAQGQGG